MRLGEVFEFRGAEDLTIGVAGVIFEFVPATIVQPIRFGYIITNTDLDNTPTPISARLNLVTYDKAGTATTTNGVGGVVLTDAAVDRVDGSIIYADLTDEVIVKPGESLEFELVTAPTGGDGIPFFHYQQLNWDLNSLRAQFSDEDGTDDAKLKLVDAAV